MTFVKLCWLIVYLRIWVPDRQQAHSDAVENDVAQGAEDQGIPEEEGGGKTS